MLQTNSETVILYFLKKAKCRKTKYKLCQCLKEKYIHQQESDVITVVFKRDYQKYILDDVSQLLQKWGGF